MNRLFFRPDQAGMTKTSAAKQTLMGMFALLLISDLNMLDGQKLILT